MLRLGRIFYHNLVHICFLFKYIERGIAISKFLMVGVLEDSWSPFYDLRFCSCHPNVVGLRRA